MVGHRAATLAVVGLLLSSATEAPTARADDRDVRPFEATSQQQEDRGEGPDIEPRAMPDYDGRGEDPMTAGEVLLWVPRILLSPLYLLSEFVIRRPLGAFVTAIERGEWAPWLTDLFDFSKTSDFGFVPTTYVEFGFRFNVGFYLFIDNAPFDGNHFRIHAATGGVRYLKATVIDRIPLGDDGSTLILRGHASRRSDHLYAGLGYDTRTSHSARYQADRMEAGMELEVPGWRSTHLHLDAGVRRMVFGDEGTCCGDPEVGQLVAEGVLEAPGIEEGYTVFHQTLRLAIDSRDPERASDSGIRIELDWEHAFDIFESLERRWFRYGVVAGPFFELPDHRSLSVMAGVRFIDPLGPAPVPFNERSLLDGETLLRGFPEGRLHGRSALSLNVEYRWPIWIWLAGALQLAVGNAYGAHLDGLSLDTLRMSASLGFRTVGRPDHAFHFLIAMGTETVDQGLSPTSFRILIGTTSGF